MSGQCTRMKYDQDAYLDSVKASTAIYKHTMDKTRYANCDNCYDKSRKGGNTVSRVKNSDLIDVDSLLRGASKRSSGSINGQQASPITQQMHVIKDCPNSIRTQHSRYSHPVYETRGFRESSLRLDYPTTDPQCNIFHDFSVNTRLQSKDAHKTVWQEPIDQSVFLP